MNTMLITYRPETDTVIIRYGINGEQTETRNLATSKHLLDALDTTDWRMNTDYSTNQIVWWAILRF